MKLFVGRHAHVVVRRESCEIRNRFLCTNRLGVVPRQVGLCTASGPTLAYGRNWHSPNFYCWSAIDGVICRSLYSKHGFMINRSGRWTETFRYVPNLATDYGGSGAYAYGGTYSGSGGSGYTVICADGWVSQSGGIQGACSSHGGYG